MDAYYGRCVRWLSGFLLLILLTGCATNKINWPSRVGTYTLDQAVVDYGPPDKQAKLQDGSTVVEWMTHRGRTYAHVPMGYGSYPWAYGPYYSPFIDTYNTPDYFLRLVFSPEGVLKDFRRVTK